MIKRILMVFGVMTLFQVHAEDKVWLEIAQVPTGSYSIDFKHEGENKTIKKLGETNHDLFVNLSPKMSEGEFSVSLFALGFDQLFEADDEIKAKYVASIYGLGTIWDLDFVKFGAGLGVGNSRIKLEKELLEESTNEQQFHAFLQISLGIIPDIGGIGRGFITLGYHAIFERSFEFKKFNDTQIDISSNLLSLGLGYSY